MTEPNRRESVQDRLRREDDRLAYVERGLLAAQLGTTIDDLELLRDATLVDLLLRPSAVVLTIGASRLLERLDAHAARKHPVNLDRPSDDVTVARVAYDDGELTAALQHNLAETLISLEINDREVAELDVDETENLAYALLRLVELARADRDADRRTIEET